MFSGEPWPSPDALDELRAAVKGQDRQAVAAAAERALALATEINTAVSGMLLEAGWSWSEVDLFLVGVREE